jgi:transcriptional regulator with XRE-family HTH domain
MRRPAVYNADNPGHTIRVERLKRGMTQQELALAIKVKPAMVARMERNNHGLDSVQTRRDIAIALGISPFALGVGSKTDTKTRKLYSTTILRTTLDLHREAFYTTGNFGIPAVNKMVGEIAGILKEEGNPREILEVYTEYNTLGILIAREELNQGATEVYIKKSLDAARSLNNPVLLARALGAASNAMYKLGNLSQAETYALEADSIGKIPNHLKALVHVDLGLATNNSKTIEKAQSLVLRDNDFPQINLDLGYCYMYGALVLLNTGKLDAAEVYLTASEEQTPKRFARRHCILQSLQAEYYIATKEYENAHHIAETALVLAQNTKSKLNIHRLRGIIFTIKEKK